MLYLKIIAIPCFVLSNHVVRPDAVPMDLNVHPEHLPYVLNSITKHNKTRCWGYENDCDIEHRYLDPVCPGPGTSWAPTKRDQIDAFYDQGDFGYVKLQREEITYMCEPINQDDSSLECTNHLKFCRGHNIMINFENILNKNHPIRYQMDVLTNGQIGGKCKFHKEKLDAQCDHLSPLQSWSPELRFFTTIDQYPGKCDLIITEPTVIMKIDATVNMYHHFCDFLNLYASQHVNSSGASMFSKNIHILVWESFAYESAFSETFQAFTMHPIWNLNTFRGQVVCFNDIILPLLPRMIFGLYYNTPLIDGCENSGLFKAFSQHVLHRLNIDQKPNDNGKIRITFLSRNTKYRNVLNENELITALNNHSQYEVKKVVYSGNILTFKEQIQITYNTDIFIGMHGAGLTHLLFLPEWAVLFELYNCEDEHCYKDLARLRGVKYITWRDINKFTMQDKGHHPDQGAHAKFTNYSFDKDEFISLVDEAAIHVKKYKHGYSPKLHDEF
ncbi:EGF domain-specific O-linked N-acetylglucosamine transferase [Aphis craccivora]|uniref:EGF domain-specific O-linked N-acetylglucosamine transferase n=1 Tax=Aphis craccivora TaxID=307492 RepID=A0A6G0YTA5_APHCR|nr:EGF domain-specific O-linked N-acetylglucosamine transferase [Aphis craccivora]